MVMVPVLAVQALAVLPQVSVHLVRRASWPLPPSRLRAGPRAEGSVCGRSLRSPRTPMTPCHPHSMSGQAMNEMFDRELTRISPLDEFKQKLKKSQRRVVSWGG